MKLSKRLQAIYDMVPGGVLADVGSDHGKLVISLFENGVISKGYAIENKEGPYKCLVANIKKHHLLDDVIPMFSDGISELPPSVETVVIAGMGGNTIIEILKAHPLKLKNVKTIIVDAHCNVPEVRKEVSKLGYVIEDEDIIEEDGIYYEIIKFMAGECAFLDDPDIEFGPKLRIEKSLTFKAKYQSRIDDINRLLDKKTLPPSRENELYQEKEKIQSIL